MVRFPRRPVVTLLMATLALFASACGSSSTGSASKSSAVPSSAAPASAVPSSAVPASPAGSLPSTPGAGNKFYVSIGDSYAAGYQPGRTRSTGRTTTSGFAYRLATDTVGGHGLTLVNFGCAGATTTSLIQQNGCEAKRLGPGASNYPTQTQAQAAEAFISAHRADVGLVTVVIGGNDITSCAKAADVVGCLTAALAKVKDHLKTFLTGLRAAAGPSVRIVGLTYPDVVLGSYTSSNARIKGLASLSVTAFRSLVNPALASAYAAINATFVDVTAATGAYTPFSQTTQLAPYGTVPVAVARVCVLTYYCQLADIHPRDAGYQLIADLVRKTLGP